jgi:hypothetical protein
VNNEEELYDWWFEEQKEIPFEIIEHGYINSTDGPDILEAEIEIEGIRYKGNVELDLRANRWITHGHFQSHYFSGVLLHIFVADDLLIYHGNTPRFSYSLETKILSKPKSPANFLERKHTFIKTYLQIFSEKEIYDILFARTLGYFHNREAMTYLALMYDQLQVLPYKQRIAYANSKLSEYKKSVRPSNRLQVRIEQYFILKEHKQIEFSRRILKDRLPLNKLVKRFYEEFNQYLADKIGKDRIEQWLFNAAIPFELFFMEEKSPFFLYLEELFEELKTRKSLKNFHNDKNIHFSQ